MHVIKPNSLGLAFRPMEYRKRFGLCVSGYLHIPFEQKPGGTLWGEQSMWQFLSAEMEQPLIDEGISKLSSEFLVHGYAYPDRNTREAGAVAVRARLGEVEKTLLAFGDRYWDQDRISPPAAFERIALNWRNAYGGPGYPNNVHGKGRTALEGVKWLPNLEYPDSRVVQRRQEVKPAAFTALDAMHPQRAALRGTYDDNWLKEHSPGFAPDLNWKHFNLAATDQWMPQPLRGDESFQLENMHPQRALIQGALPGLRVRAFARVRSDATQTLGKLREIAMRLSTVWFFPHAERMVLVFHGLAESAQDDAGDIDLLLGAVERLSTSEQRDDAHYLEVIAKRTASENADLYSLVQSDLVPPGLDTRDPAFEAVTSAIKPAGFREDAALRRGQIDMEFARNRAIAKGQDPDRLGLKKPEREPEPTLDEIPALVIQQRKDQVEQQWSVIDKLLTRYEQIKRGLDAGTLDPATLVHRGPPKLKGAATFAAIDQAHRRSGQPLDRKDLTARMALSDDMQKFQYLQGAHEQAPAIPLIGADAQRVREEVEWMLSRDFKTWKGFDFTGADLSNLDLRGVDLSDAWLESANFENSNLSRANLSSAVLAHANLRGMVAVNANFESANLGGANLESALLDNSNLTGVTLNKALVRRAEMRRVQITSASLHETMWELADWSEAEASGVTFYQLDLRQCIFPRANLASSLFVECDLRGVDFRGARMTGANLNGCKTDGAIFEGADLGAAVFSGGTKLAGADFSNANLRGANFGDSLLIDTRWIGATLDEANLAGVDLSRADLTSASAKGTLLRKAVLRGGKLVRANLIGAILQGADLRSVDLRDANLFGADLSRVKLDGDVRMHGTLLERARTYPRLTVDQHEA